MAPLACRRLADAFRQRSCQRRSWASLRAALHAWRAAVAAKQQRRGQEAHARALLRRRLLGRVVAGWWRAMLAGKLCRTLEVVRQLQGAVERVGEELQHKARQVSLRALREWGGASWAPRAGCLPGRCNWGPRMAFVAVPAAPPACCSPCCPRLPTYSASG